MLEDMLFV